MLSSADQALSVMNNGAFKVPLSVAHWAASVVSSLERTNFGCCLHAAELCNFLKFLIHNQTVLLSSPSQ
eukprot:544561-Hanusia_phi.AAC.1